MLLSPDLPAIFREDAADLHRLEIAVGKGDGRTWDCAINRKDAPALTPSPHLLISV